MKHHLPAAVLTAVLGACAGSAAQAGVYVTGSYSLQSTNLGFQTSGTEGGSASVDVDLGHYIRLGYTYGYELQSTRGFKDSAASTNPSMSADSYCTNSATCRQVYSNTTVISNSLGLTVILYEGQSLMPFALGGVTMKRETVDQVDFDTTGNLAHSTYTIAGTPKPYGGGGLGIRLNRDFTLKFSYQVSPSSIQQPGMQAQKTWDRQSNAGLTYQL